MTRAARKLHVAFILEPVSGHIIPTLGIAAELIRRGHRVSYPVAADFAPAIRRVDAHPMIFKPLDPRPGLCQTSTRADHRYDLTKDNPEVMKYLSDMREIKTADTLAQLTALYAEDRPDVVIHDDVFDIAGRTLADDWQIPRIRHWPMIWPHSGAATFFAGDKLVIIPVPRFFVEDADAFDERFHFVGFVAEGRSQSRGQSEYDNDARITVLASASTGFLPQVEYYERITRAFESLPWRVILSIGRGLDPASEVSAQGLAHRSPNVVLNQRWPNFDVLEHASLFICQGGQGSVLEALYRGVPQLIMSPSQLHDLVSRRLQALGLGLHLDTATISPDQLREAAISLLEDAATLQRVKDAQAAMHADRAAQCAADLIEQYA